MSHSRIQSLLGGKSGFTFGMAQDINRKRQQQDVIGFFMLDTDQFTSEHWHTAQRAVIARFQQELIDMKLPSGSTFCSVVIEPDDYLHVTFIGDSSALLVALDDNDQVVKLKINENNEIICSEQDDALYTLRLNRLHVPEVVVPENDADMSEKQFENYPESLAIYRAGGFIESRNKLLRVSGRLLMSRALGDALTVAAFKRPENSVFHQPEIKSYKFIRPLDKKITPIVIVASDGFTDKLQLTEIAHRINHQYKWLRGDSVELAQDLVRYAKSADSHDNISVGVMQMLAHSKSCCMFVADGHGKRGLTVAAHVERFYKIYLSQQLREIACREFYPVESIFINLIIDLIHADEKHVPVNLLHGYVIVTCEQLKNSLNLTRAKERLLWFRGWLENGLKYNDVIRVMCMQLICQRYAPFYDCLGVTPAMHAIEQLKVLHANIVAGAADFYAKIERICNKVPLIEGIHYAHVNQCMFAPASGLHKTQSHLNLRENTFHEEDNDDSFSY